MNIGYGRENVERASRVIVLARVRDISDQACVLCAANQLRYGLQIALARAPQRWRHPPSSHPRAGPPWPRQRQFVLMEHYSVLGVLLGTAEIL